MDKYLDQVHPDSGCGRTLSVPGCEPGLDVRPMNKRPVIALALMVISAAGIGFAASAGPGGGFRPTPLSEDQLLDELDYLPGDKHVPPGSTVAVDPGLNADELQRYGPYRIVPPTFAGDLPYDSTIEVDEGSPSSDSALIESSALFVDLTDAIPAGFERVGIDTYDGGTNSAVRQIFRNKQEREVEVLIVRLSHLPIDILDPGEGPQIHYQNRLGEVSGYPAIFFEPSAYADETDDLLHVRFVSGSFEVGVLGRAASQQELLQIAQHVAKELPKGEDQ